MAKAIYLGDNTSRKVKKIYEGNSTAQKIKKGYIGDSSGKARLFFTNGYIWQKYNVVVTEQEKQTDNFLIPYSYFNRVGYAYNYSISNNKLYISRDNIADHSKINIFTYMYGNWTGTPKPAYVDTIINNQYAQANEGYYDIIYKFTEATAQAGGTQYIFTTMEISLLKSQGSYIGIVESDNPSQYPDNGVSGNYWYVKIDD